MMGPGGKIEWRCPFCQSSDIAVIRIAGQKSGECRGCKTFWPWRQRLKCTAEPQENKVMGKFRVGDIAIAVKPVGHIDKCGMNGTEVTIIGPLRMRYMTSFGRPMPCYLTNWPGHPGWRLRAPPEWLRRKEDKIPWSECTWQPDREPVQLSGDV